MSRRMPREKAKCEKKSTDTETYRRVVGGDEQLVRTDNAYMTQLDALRVRKGGLGETAARKERVQFSCLATRTTHI